MTDEEKRAAIEALVDAEPHIDDCPAPEFLARVRSMCDRLRAILDDAPSVEWTEEYAGGHSATVGDCDLYVIPDSERAVGWTCEILRDDRLVLRASYDAHTFTAAKASAVALYVALRGVT